MAGPLAGWNSNRSVSAYNPTWERRRQATSAPSFSNRPRLEVGGDVPLINTLSSKTQQRQEQKKQGTQSGSGLGWIVNNKTTRNLINPLYVMGAPLRGVLSTADQIGSLLEGDGVSFNEWRTNLEDPGYNFEDIVGNPFNNKVADSVLHFAGDVAFDPLTYLTLGVAPIAGKTGRASGAKRLLEAAAATDDAAAAARLQQKAGELGRKGWAALDEETYRIAAPKAKEQGLRFMGKSLPGTRGVATRVGGAVGEAGAQLRKTPGAGTVRSALGRAPDSVHRAYETLAKGATGGELEKAVNTINDYQRIRLGGGTFGALARPIGDRLQQQAKRVVKASGLSEADLIEKHELNGSVSFLGKAGNEIAQIAEGLGVKIKRRKNWVPHQLLPDARMELQKLFLDDEGARRAVLKGDNVFTEDLLRPSGVLDQRVFTPYGGIEEPVKIGDQTLMQRKGLFRRVAEDGRKVEIRIERGTIKELNEKLPQLFPELGNIKYYEDRIPAMYRNYIDDLAGDVGGVSAFRSAADDALRSDVIRRPETPENIERGTYKVENGKLAFDDAGKPIRVDEPSAAQMAQDLEDQGVFRLTDEGAATKQYVKDTTKAAEATRLAEWTAKDERKYGKLLGRTREAIDSMMTAPNLNPSARSRAIKKAQQQLDELTSASTRGRMGRRSKLDEAADALRSQIDAAKAQIDNVEPEVIDPHAADRFSRDAAREELQSLTNELSDDIAKYTTTKEGINDFISEGGLDKYLAGADRQTKWLNDTRQLQDDMNYGRKRVGLKAFEEGHLPPDEAQAKLSKIIGDMILPEETKERLTVLAAEASTEIPDLPPPVIADTTAITEQIGRWQNELDAITSKIDSGRYPTKAEYQATKKKLTESIAGMERDKVLSAMRKKLDSMPGPERADLERVLTDMAKLGDASKDPALRKADTYLREAAVMSADAKNIKMTNAQVDKVLKQLSTGKGGKIVTAQLRDEWEAIFEGMAEGGDILITPELAQMWRNLREIEKQPGQIGRLARAYTNLFKTYATSTPGFHVRNGVSATIMNAIAGVSPRSMYRGVKEWEKFASAVKEGRAWEYYQGLTPEMKRAFQGVFGSGTGGQYLESGVGQRAEVMHQWSEKAFNNFYTKMLGRRPGQFVEGSVRLGMAIDSVNRGYDVVDIMNRITKFHFDYSQVSKFDQKMKQWVPFWTFMSRNLPLQISQMWTKPKVYNWLAAAERDFGVEPNNFTPKYILENGGIPINAGPVQWFLQPDLAHQRIGQDVGMVEDLLSFEDPARILSTLNPGITAPAEFGLRQDFFTGKRYGERDVVKVGGLETPIGMILEKLNLGEKAPDGSYIVEERAIDMIRSLLPLYDRAARVAPGAVEGSGSDLPLGLSKEGVSRYLGSPFRSVTREDRERYRRGLEFDANDQRRREQAVMEAMAGP